MADVSAGFVLCDLLRCMVRNLVDEPEAVCTSVRQEGTTVFLSVSVADGDQGKVIGKQGRTARSLRTIVRGAGMRLGVSVDVNIEQPELRARVEA